MSSGESYCTYCTNGGATVTVLTVLTPSLGVPDTGQSAVGTPIDVGRVSPTWWLVQLVQVQNHAHGPRQGEKGPHSL